MKKVLLSLLAGTALVANVALADNVKIAVFDLSQVLRESKQAHDVQSKLERTFKPRQEKIIAQQKTLEQKAEKLKRDEAILSDADKTKLQNDIMRSRRDIQRLEQDFQQDFTMTQQKEMQELVAKVRGIIKQIANKEKYDIILRSDTIPYVRSSSNLDITKQVLRQLS